MDMDHERHLTLTGCADTVERLLGDLVRLTVESPALQRQIRELTAEAQGDLAEMRKLIERSRFRAANQRLIAVDGAISLVRSLVRRERERALAV